MHPEWLDKERYPFQANYFHVPAGALHYVDEGHGKPIVFLHGNPDWSFTYRKVMKILRPQFRCIAPDHIGFGLSAKPANWSYHPQAHAENLEKLLLRLDLKDICLVVNDWGGPIGFDFLVKHPERVTGVVILNTWMWPLRNYPLFRLFSRLMSGKTGRLLTGKLNIFTKILVRLAVHQKAAFTGKVHRHYQKPCDSPDKRIGSIILPRYLQDATPWFQNLYDNRAILQEKRCLLIWGMKDPAFRPYFLKKWQEILPEAPVYKLSKAGHYPQECQTEVVIKLLKDLLE